MSDQSQAQPTLVYRLANRLNSHDIQLTMWDPKILSSKGQQVLNLIQAWGQVDTITQLDTGKLVEQAVAAVEHAWKLLDEKGWLLTPLPHAEAVERAWTTEVEATLLAKRIHDFATPPAGIVGSRPGDQAQ